MRSARMSRVATVAVGVIALAGLGGTTASAATSESPKPTPPQDTIVVPPQDTIVVPPGAPGQICEFVPGVPIEPGMPVSPAKPGKPIKIQPIKGSTEAKAPNQAGNNKAAKSGQPDEALICWTPLEPGEGAKRK